MNPAIKGTSNDGTPPFQPDEMIGLWSEGISICIPSPSTGRFK
jgi:hypothetical protein